MSVCGQCGLALEQGASHCGGCGAPVASPEAPPRPAEEKPKWGTLIRAPRPLTGPLGVPNPIGEAGGDALPVPRMPAVRHSDPEAMPGSLAAEASAQAARAVRRAPSAPLTEPRHPALRAPSGPIAGAVAHPAAGSAPTRQIPARAPSAPLAAGRQPAARQPSGAVAQPRHPAMRAPSGPITGSVALPGAKPRAPSGAFALNLPPSAAAEPANANHLDTGMLELDDRFGGPLEAGPSLEVASLQPQAHPQRHEPAPAQPQAQPRREAPRRESPRPAPREAPAELRAKRIRDLARYPTVPEQWIGAVAYFFKVYARRRELESQVLKLTQQRKRLDIANDDALCALGQALYAKRDEPQLEPLSAQLRVVSDAAQETGARVAAAKRTEAGLSQEIAAAERELAEAQAAAAPVQEREATLSQTVDLHLQQIKRREMLIRKAEVEAKSDPGRLQEFQTERETHRAEIQALQAKLPPFEQELDGVRAKLEKQRAQIAALQERLRKLQGAMGREHERERVAVGGSQSAHREALRSLANAAMRREISPELAPAEHKAAFEARQIAEAQRESEELMRAATSSFDARVYQRGMQLVLGCVVGVFLLFVALIVF